jgi:manganese/zinc/iron transport system substrate-binding protein
LHASTKTDLAAIPPERRVLVTAHDAFHYFGEAYDIEVRAIQGISTESEAGVRQVRALVDFLVERKIKAVFVETSVADENIRSLIEGCQARNHDVKIGGTLFSDAMGDAGTEEGTYEGMVKHNVKTIVGALK